MYIPLSRRPLLILALLLGSALLFGAHRVYRPRTTWFSTWQAEYQPTVGLEEQDYAVLRRVEHMRAYCEREDEFEREYGRTNLRLSRAYEGSHHAMRQFLLKALRGEKLVVSAIGGSVTKGHAVYGNEVWFHRFVEWLGDFFPSDVKLQKVNGAAPATGSDYFSFCFLHHIPPDSDFVFVELAVNDEGILEHVENMENLLRGLLDLPNKPAVVLVEVLAFSNGGMGGGGGRMHLPVAQYYDVPVINQRHPLANHFARYPQLIRPYFAQDYWGNPDTRHLNSRGHRDLGILVASLLKDAACEMFAEADFTVPSPLTTDNLPVGLALMVDELEKSAEKPDPAADVDADLAMLEASWPEQARSWRKQPADGQDTGDLMPGMWITPVEHGLMPRLKVLQGWNDDTTYVVPAFHPTCLTTRATNPAFNLTPSANDGWEFWVHEEHLDKPYLMARTPGARVSFELETAIGVVKMYSLRSATFGLGTIECWADDDRDRAVKVVGWWGSDMNIGRFATIREDLRPGRHTIVCELLRETSDPRGGHEFRMISLMSV